MKSLVAGIWASVMIGVMLLSACRPIQAVAPSAPNTQAATTVVSAEETANLAVVDGFFTALVKNKDAKAVATYLADDFVSHSPDVVGKQGMVDFAAWQAANLPKADFVEVFHTIAKGDTVIKHYTYTSDPAKGAESLIADFFRLKDGKIVEYWDVVLPMEQKK